ncbi:MAG: tetratricopeptide repeat protein, partial [bacterium]|nr:tetratricopeptide repeat protein [bacterium]
MNLRRLFWTLIFLCATPVFGATVLLEDGTVLKGEIVSETETEIVIRTSWIGELKLSRSSVVMLEREGKKEGEGSTGGAAELQDSFGEFEDQVAGLILAEVAGADTAAFYRALGRKAKGPFLERFWRATNSMVLKYYYNHHFGDRYYTVSDAYFERGNLIPRKYQVGAPIPHREGVEAAKKILDRMLILHPDDPVAMSALGYVKLELDEVKEAEKLFLKAIKKERRFVEARNGRALAVLKKPSEKSRALKLFRETCAMDDNYAAAHYNLAMCHLSMVGLDRVDLDHYFGRVVKRFPDHYDAYFKLGMFYESLRYYDKAMAAYSRQAAVNAGHPITPSRLAHVAMMLKARGKKTYSLVDLEKMALKSPKDYLPLLAEALVDREDFARAQDAYARYLAVLGPTEREFYEDLSLLSTPKESARMRSAYGRGLTRLREQFWLLSDPTPTTRVNERRVEHYRR